MPTEPGVKRCSLTKLEDIIEPWEDVIINDDHCSLLGICALQCDNGMDQAISC